jgi:hypothetical protein
MPSKGRSRKRLDDTERAEKRKKERALMAQAVEALRCSDGWRRWLRVRRSFHSYSLHNQLLIAFQKPDATRIAGFRKWLELGYAVRKGERAIWIWAPCRPSKKKIQQWEREGGDPDRRPRTFFRMVAVFDRSQVDPLPDFPGGPAQLDPPIEPIGGDGLARFLAPLRQFAESLGYSFSIEETPPNVDGSCDRKKKRVVVRHVGADFSPNAQVATAVHEDAHALLDASPQEDDPTLTYAEEEMVVECVAYSVCSALGLDTSGSSVPYVAVWGKGDQIDRYASLIDRLASRIEGALLGAAELLPDPGGAGEAAGDEFSEPSPSLDGARPALVA